MGMPLEHPRTEAGAHCGHTTENWNPGVLPAICCLCLRVTTPLEIYGAKCPGKIISGISESRDQSDYRYLCLPPPPGSVLPLGDI